jgi:hypothetical protein
MSDDENNFKSLASTKEIFGLKLYEI